MKYSAEAIGKTIRLEREKRGWSQEALGKKIHCVGKQISNYEKGETVPPLDKLFSFCKIFDCELGYLLGEPNYTEGTTFKSHFSELTGFSSDLLPVLTELSQKGIRKHESQEYAQILYRFLQSSNFYEFSSLLKQYNDLYIDYSSGNDSVSKKYGQAAVNETIDYHEKYDTPWPGIDYPNPPPHYVEIISELEKQSSQREADYLKLRFLRYELQESLIYILDELFPNESK